MNILSWITLVSSLYNFDPKLVTSLIEVESQFNASIVGADGEIGLMQILPTSVGRTKKELLDPYTNITEGVRFLSEMRDKCKHKKDHTYLVCYNMGVAAGRKVNHPKSYPYYKKIMKLYERKTYGY